MPHPVFYIHISTQILNHWGIGQILGRYNRAETSTPPSRTDTSICMSKITPPGLRARFHNRRVSREASVSTWVQITAAGMPHPNGHLIFLTECSPATVHQQISIWNRANAEENIQSMNMDINRVWWFCLFYFDIGCRAVDNVQYSEVDTTVIFCVTANW